MKDQKTRIQQDNRGVTLVELIIAITIAVIVSGSIAALMLFAVRMYRNESVNTAMQYELQTNLNTMMDEIMGSQTVVVIQNSGGDKHHVNQKDDVKVPYTRCALFGKFIGTSGTGRIKFSGVVFVSGATDSEGKFKVYMNRVKDIEGDDPADVAKSCYDTVKGAFSKDPNPYLLGENLVQFVIEPDPEGVILDASEHTYTNPISVKVELSFARNGWGEKKYSKHVADVAYLRNRVGDIVKGNTTVPAVYIGTVVGDDLTAVTYNTFKVRKKDE